MKKRKNEGLDSFEKKVKNSEENNTEISQILQFCSSLNTQFHIMQEASITEENLEKFLEILKTHVIKIENGNNLHILHYLAQQENDIENNIQFAKYFIKNGGEVNQKNNGGHSPLVYAMVNENRAFVNLLLENRADVNSQNIHGNSILHNLIKQEIKVDRSIEKLVQCGANIEVLNNKGKTPLEVAFDHQKAQSLLCLINHGAKITKYIENDIFKKEPINDQHKLCQNLSYLATIAWDFLTSENQEPVRVSKSTGERYVNLAGDNGEIIKKMALSIIVASPFEIGCERLKNYQEAFENEGLSTVISTESFFIIERNEEDVVVLADEISEN